MHTVIVGNGISGVTAAKWLRKLSEHKITIISSETKHFFSRTALMYVYMGHMRFEDIKPYENWFWEKNRIDLKEDKVIEIRHSANAIRLQSNEEIQYDNLILALGSKPNKFGWPGQNLDRVGGLYHLQDLEYMEKYSPGLKKAVIVGGGLIGIEMAEMFRSRNIDVTMLVRESNYWNNVLPEEESEMISKHISDHHIDLRLGVNLDSIVDDGNGKANGVKIKETGESIECQFVGLTAGVSPNIAWLKDSQIETNRGILVNDFLQTNINNIYAIGDCAEIKNPNEGRRPIEAVWYTGRMMGETAAYNICGKPIKYDPGIWFNSAKFLDIEYQVYGDVPNQPKEGISSLYWQHAEKNLSIRINYNTSEKHVTGFNLMGIRYRHEVCEKWLKDKSKIETVLQNLSLANFDPEFFEQYESDLVKTYNAQSNSNIRLNPKKGLNRVFKFLKS